MMRKYACYLLALLLALLLAGCDLIDYHPYDGKLDSDTSTNSNAKNIELIEAACAGKDTIRFIFMGIPNVSTMRWRTSWST